MIDRHYAYPPIGMLIRQGSGIAWKANGAFTGMEIKTSAFRHYGQLIQQVLGSRSKRVGRESVGDQDLSCPPDFVVHSPELIGTSFRADLDGSSLQRLFCSSFGCTTIQAKEMQSLRTVYSSGESVFKMVS